MSIRSPLRRATLPVTLLVCAVAPALPVAAGELAEVVISATALRETADQTSTPASVLSGEELLLRRASSLGETLESMPGVTATWFGPQASRPVIRGLGGERVQIYEDGADALDVGALSDDHAITIDSLLAERIEVIRGPATLLFGNAAAAGLVNVRSNRIPTAQGTGPGEAPISGAAEVRANTALDERAVVARAAGGSGGWRVSADLHRRETGNVSIPGLALSGALRAELAEAGEPINEAQGRLANSASAARGGSIGVSRVGPWGYFGLAGSRYNTEYQIPGPKEEEDDESGSEAAGDSPPMASAALIGGDGVSIDMGQARLDAAGEWLVNGSIFQSLRFRAAYNDYEHREIEPGGALGTRFLQKGGEARLSAEHQLPGGWRGSIGVQVRDIDLTAIGEEAFIPPSTTRNTGLFLYEERAFGALTLELGARLEEQSIRIDDGSARADYDDTSFSAAAGLIWQIAEPLQLALNLNATERHPTATELFADGPHLAVRRFEIGDETLGKEQGRSIDLALRRTQAGWRGSVSLFRSDYSAFIYARRTGTEADGLPVIQFTAAGAEFIGGELELRSPDLDLAAGRLTARVFGDYVRAKLEDGTPLPQIPPLRLGASASLTQRNLTGSLEAIWHDAASRLSSAELPTPGFTLVNASLSYRAPLAAIPTTFFIRGTNLLDEDARRHASPLKDFAPLPGRGLGAGFRIEF